MPSNRIKTAQQRLDRAKERVDLVKGLAESVIATAKRKVALAAKRKASWKVIELFLERTFATLGTSSYIWISAVGLTYSIAFYFRFEGIQIIDFFETSDFLLSAFGNVIVPIIAAIVTFVSLVTLRISYYEISRDQAYSPEISIESSAKPWKNASTVLVFPVLVTFLFPFLWGMVDSHWVLKEQSPRVRVTVGQDPDQRFAHLSASNRTVLLGTTSNFHIIHECESELISIEELSDDEKVESCDEGQTYVIPNANIAAMEFAPWSKSPANMSGIAKAIANLKDIFDDLKL